MNYGMEEEKYGKFHKWVRILKDFNNLQMMNLCTEKCMNKKHLCTDC